MGKKNKAKRNKFIAKISRDGKISKKEGRKAAKKGISLRKIQNRNIGAYRDASRSYDRTPTERRSSTRPSFEPLKIKRGAERADFARQMQNYKGVTRGGGDRKPPTIREPEPKPGFVPKFLPTSDFVDQPVSVDPIIDEGPSPEDMFRDQIAGMEAGFAKSFQEQQAMFQQLQAEQNERMALLQQQMREQAMAGRDRPQVAGVKTAQGIGGTAMQIAKRGVGGAFGRGGLRISSLNI